MLGVARGAARYRTVTNAWRAAQLRNGREVGADRGVGFRVLDSTERVDGGVKGAQQGLNKTMRSIRRASIVKTEDPALVRKQDLLRRLGSAITQEATEVLRQIEPPKAQEQLPRPKPLTSVKS